MVTEEMVIQCLQLTKSFNYLDLVSMYKLVYMTSNSLKNNVYEFNGTFNIDYIMVHYNLVVIFVRRRNSNIFFSEVFMVFVRRLLVIC